MRSIRIYNGLTMKHEKNIECSSYILAIEYIPDKNAICVSISDKTLIFYEAG